jgi:hypothetical protein
MRLARGPGSITWKSEAPHCDRVAACSRAGIDTLVRVVTAYYTMLRLVAAGIDYTARSTIAIENRCCRLARGPGSITRRDTTQRNVFVAACTPPGSITYYGSDRRAMCAACSGGIDYTGRRAANHPARLRLAAGRDRLPSCMPACSICVCGLLAGRDRLHKRRAGVSTVAAVAACSRAGAITLVAAVQRWTLDAGLLAAVIDATRGRGPESPRVVAGLLAWPGSITLIDALAIAVVGCGLLAAGSINT